MSTDGALSRSRLLPSLLGILLLLMGLAMLAGGIKLSMLGGSLYYLLAGIGLALTGVLLIAARRAALGLYALVLFASTVWALWEVGLDWWQLVPRLAMLFALGIVMLLPWFRRPLLSRCPDGHWRPERGRGRSPVSPPWPASSPTRVKSKANWIATACRHDQHRPGHARR